MGRIAERVTISVTPELASRVRDYSKDKDMAISSVYRRGAALLMEKEVPNEN